jgi:glutathione S-transferase
MIILYSLENSRSMRVKWLMEELGLPYEAKEFKRAADYSAPEEFKNVTPLGKSPTIVDGDVVLFESGAILEYIIHKYGEGRLAVTPTHADYPLYIEWMHAVEGTLMPQLVQTFLLARAGVEESSPLMARAIAGRNKLLAYVNTELGSRPYIGGQEFTAADILMLYPLQIMGAAKVDISGYEHIQEYMKRIMARPAFKKIQ